MQQAPDWTQGYVSDIPYTYGFYREMGPTLMRLALLDRGIESPAVDRPFRYCELGTGFGLTLNMLAASNPDAEFYGNDFNPQHIAESRALAAEGGLDNVQFFDDSFLEFLNRDLPPFDYIGVHGIYSWISDENRRAIVDFIGKNLRPGGAAYVSYNCMPGWGPMAPVRYLMARATDGHRGSSLARVDKAMDLLNSLIDAKASYFARNPQIAKRLEKTKEQSKSYVAHEYFNGYWNPLFFDQAADELSEARLTFGASANLTEHVDAVNITKDGQKILSEIDDPVLRETVRDFLTGQQFRRDIYVRGAPPLQPQNHATVIREQRFAAARRADKLELKQSFPVGQVTLQEKVYKPFVEILEAEGPKTVDELMAHEKLQGIKLNSIWQACMILAGLQHIDPVFEQDEIDKRKKSTDRFNAALLRMARDSDRLRYMATPASGSASNVNRLEMLFMLAEQEGVKDPPQYVWDLFKERGHRLRKEGKVLESDKENLEHIRGEFENFTEQRKPILSGLGVI